MASTYNDNSVKDNKSRYVQGGTTEVPDDTRLGWWERRTFLRSHDDETIVLEARYDKRPDLLAYDKFKSVKLEWLVLQYNNIVDIEEEFVTGATITLPTYTRVLTEMLNRPTGGANVKST